MARFSRNCRVLRALWYAAPAMERPSLARSVGHRRSLVSLALVAALSATVAAPDARADNNADEAELQFQLAAERYQAGDFRGALEHFLASNRLSPNRNVAFNIARSYAALRRFPEAYRYYLEALDGETNENTRRAVETAMNRITNEVSVVRVESDPAGASIFVDRRDLGARGTSPRVLAFAPGTVRILLDREGYESAQSEPLALEVGRTRTVRLSLRRIVGTLRVEGPRGAIAHLDDENAPVQCALPCSLDAPPGAHTVWVTQQGFQSFSRSVTVLARQEVAVRAELQALTGSVIINASERDALVEVDGRPSGFTPAVVRDVAIGRRRVRISLAGYAPVEREIDVRYGQPTEISDVQLRSSGEVTAASRVAERIEDAPASVSVIDGRELRAFGYPTIVEALRGARGVAVHDDSAYASVGIRGLGILGNYGNRVLVLADGHPMNDDVIGSSYVGYDNRVDLDDVERIELVRGPGSVLYGTSAFSGVINLVSRGRSVPNRVHAQIGAMGEGVMRARAGFSLGFGRDAGVTASVGIARTDGADRTVQQLDESATPARLVERTARNNAAFTAGTFNARAWWKDLSLQLFWSARDVSNNLGVYGTVFGDNNSHLVDARSFAEVRFEPRIGSIGRLFLRAHANLYQFRSAYTYEPNPTTEEYDSFWYGVEARAQFDIHRAFRLTAGGEFQHHPAVSFFALDRVTNVRSVDVKSPLLVGAGYLLAEGDPVSWFRYSLGARVDVYNTFGASVNPRAAMIFRPAQAATLKVTGGQAFRAPSVYELYFNDGGLSQRSACDPTGRTPCALGPETIRSAEVEYSHRFLSEWVAVAAAHGSLTERVIVSEGAGTMTDPSVYRNAAAPILVVGGDVELRREWLGGWMLAVMYGYQRARQLDPSGEKLVLNTSEHLASARAVAPIVPGLLQIATRLSLESPRPVRASALSMEQEFSPWAVVGDVVASGRVERFGIRYSVGVYNVFDWRYSLPVNEVFAHRFAPQPGRTFMLNVGAGF
jgi:outer membrane receptor for ferrienterochelin and colicins